MESAQCFTEEPNLMARKTRWILTGLIAFALGGLVVWAKGVPNFSENRCPYSATPAYSPPPNQPTKLVAELPTATAPEEVKKPVADPGPLKPLPAPYALEPVTPPSPLPKPSDPVPTTPTMPPAATPSAAPPSPMTEPTPPMPSTPVPPMPTAPVAPGNVEPARFNPAPTSDAPPIAPPATGSSPVPTPAAVVAPCPWVFKVEIVDGRTQLEARTEKEVQFRVSCEHLNLQAPNGTIEAQGGVKVASLNLDGSCDRLTITWQDDKVQLQGQVRLKCRKEGQEVELTGEKVSVKLTATGPAKESVTRKPVSETPTAGEKVSTQVKKVKHETEEEEEVQPFDGDPEMPR